MDQVKQVETATPPSQNLVKNLWRKNWLLKLVLIGLYPLTLTYLIWKSNRLPKVVKGILLLVMWFFVLVFTAAFSSPTSQQAYQDGKKAGHEATQKKETTENTATKQVVDNNQPVQKPTEQPQPTATSTPTPTPTAQVAEKPAEQKPYNIYDDLWKALDTSLKTRQNIDIKYDALSKTATLLINQNETYWDETAMLNSAYRRMLKYGKVAFEINGVDQVGVNISTKMMDSHGKENVEEVIRVAITKTSYKDYNWDNMQYVENFYDKIVDAVNVNYINPGIFRKLNLEKIHLNLMLN